MTHHTGATTCHPAPGPGASRQSRQRGRWSATAIAALSIAVVLTTNSVPAAAGAQTSPTAGDCQSVHLGPQPGPTAQTYFALTIPAGAAASTTLIAANPTDVTCTVTLSPAYGTTATNSGDTYVAPATRCSATPIQPTPACWIQDLPADITVAPHSRQLVPFTIQPPPDTAPGQHLAGIIGHAHTPSQPAATTPAGVQVSVRTTVAIGVAVTVPGPLTPDLSIPTVTLDAQQPDDATIAIVERNTGNTWEHPSGDLTISYTPPGAHASREVSIPVTSNTVLAGDSATLRVHTTAVTPGVHPVKMQLWYAGHQKMALWEGKLNFPALTPLTRQHKQNPTAGSPLQSAGILPARLPSWLPKALAVGAFLILDITVFLFLLWRRRRRDEEDPDRVESSLGNTGFSRGRHAAEPDAG